MPGVEKGMGLEFLGAEMMLVASDMSPRASLALAVGVTVAMSEGMRDFTRAAMPAHQSMAPKPQPMAEAAYTRSGPQRALG